MVSQKSLANLKPIKKGEVRNPRGAGAQSTVTKTLKKLTIEKYKEVIETVLTGNMDDLKAYMLDPNIPAIQVGIARAFFQAISKGHYDVIERIAQRIIGKIPDELNVQANISTQAQITQIDPVKLREALQKLKNDIG